MAEKPKRRHTALAKKTRAFIADIIGTENEEAINDALGEIYGKGPLLPTEPTKKAKGGLMKKTKGYSKGGAMKKTKGYSKGGAMKKTKGYSSGGVARGMGAATKGGKFVRGG